VRHWSKPDNQQRLNMEARRARRDAVYGRGTHLRGVDLVERIAANTKIQKQRWIE
jgi:hypothetical protein